jgi:uncharacterized membrane protein YgdD (TMEM256/DUF423 family)
MKPTLVPFRLGAWICGVAVALGAYGAHGLEGWLGDRGALSPAEIGDALEWWATGNRYQMWHGLALLGLGAAGAIGRGPALGFLVGTLLFSGSLYALALGAPGAWMGPVTPIGGVVLIVSWLLVALLRPPLRTADA